MTKSLIRLGAVALAASLLTACGTSPSASPPSTNVKAKAFPLSVRSGDGVIRIASRPTRILALSPSATQMLYAIGAGKQVVGVDKYSSYPSDAPRTKFTGYETSAEDYLPLHPDLVILAFENATLVSQLRLLKIPTLVLPPATTFSDVDSQLSELGTATGHSDGVVQVEAQITTTLRGAEQTVGNAAKNKTYYVEFDPTLYSATSKTFVGAMFSLFGMHDIADAANKGSQYPQLSSEYLVKANPDYVVLADTVCCGQNATTFAHRAGFDILKAVQLHHVYGVNDSVASEWGPHTLEEFVDFLEQKLRPSSTHA